MAIGIGAPKEKVRTMMIEKMIRGAGNPPEVMDSNILFTFVSGLPVCETCIGYTY